MSGEANAQRVRGLYEALLRGDIAALIEAVTDDVEWTVHGPPEIPFAGHWRGRSGVAEFFEVVARTTARDGPHHRPEIRDVFAHGERVIAIGHDRIRCIGGDTHEGWWIHEFTFDGEKIARMVEYIDTHAAAAAFQSRDRNSATAEGSVDS